MPPPAQRRAQLPTMRVECRSRLCEKPMISTWPAHCRADPPRSAHDGSDRGQPPSLRATSKLLTKPFGSGARSREASYSGKQLRFRANVDGLIFCMSKSDLAGVSLVKWGTMNDVTELVEVAYGLDRRTVQHGPWRRLLRKAIHFFSYHLILKRRTTRMTRAAGFRLIVRPTVFHPRCFITSEFFASFISRQDLTGKRVADVGTGSGILGLAAARAGAASVTAVDVNP